MFEFNLLRRVTLIFTFICLMLAAVPAQAAFADVAGDQAQLDDLKAMATAERLCMRFPVYDLEKISAAVNEVAGKPIKPVIEETSTRWMFPGPGGRNMILVRDSRPGRLKCAFQTDKLPFTAAETWLDRVSIAFAEETGGERQGIKKEQDPKKGTATMTAVATSHGPIFFGVWKTAAGGVIAVISPLSEIAQKN